MPRFSRQRMGLLVGGVQHRRRCRLTCAFTVAFLMSLFDFASPLLSPPHLPLLGGAGGGGLPLCNHWSQQMLTAVGARRRGVAATLCVSGGAGMREARPRIMKMRRRGLQEPDADGAGAQGAGIGWEDASDLEDGLRVVFDMIVEEGTDGKASVQAVKDAFMGMGQSIGENDVEAAIAAAAHSEEGKLGFQEFHSMAINLKERAESNSEDDRDSDCDEIVAAAKAVSRPGAKADADEDEDVEGDGDEIVNVEDLDRHGLSDSPDENKTIDESLSSALEQEEHTQASVLYMKKLDGEDKDQWQPAKAWWEDQQSVITMAAKAAALQVEMSTEGAEDDAFPRAMAGEEWGVLRSPAVVLGEEWKMLQDTSESLAQAAQDKVLDDAPPIISPSGERESQGKSKGRPETDAAAAVGGRSELEADAAELIALSSSVLSSLRDVRQRRREGDVIFSKDELQIASDVAQSLRLLMRLFVHLVSLTCRVAVLALRTLAHFGMRLWEFAEDREFWVPEMTEAWIDIRKETANGTVPNNAMIIALKIEKWAIAGGSRTVSLLGPVAVSAVAWAKGELSRVKSGGAGLWANRSGIVAGFKEEWGVEGGVRGGRGERRRKGGGRRVKGQDVESPTDEIKGNSGGGQEEGEGSGRVESSSLGDKKLAEDSASISPGEGWITSSSPPPRTRYSPLDPPPRPPPSSTSTLTNTAMEKEDSDGLDADYYRESRGRNRAAAYLSSLFTASTSTASTGTADSSTSSPPPVDNVESPATSSTFGETWRRIRSASQTRGQAEAKLEPVLVSRIGSTRMVGYRPPTFPPRLPRGDGWTSKQVLVPAGGEIGAGMPRRRGFDARRWVEGVGDTLRGVGAKGAKAGSDIGTRVGGAGMYVGAWFTNTTQSVFGGRERDDIVGQLYSMWSSVEKTLDKFDGPFISWIESAEDKLQDAFLSWEWDVGEYMGGMSNNFQEYVKVQRWWHEFILWATPKYEWCEYQAKRLGLINLWRRMLLNSTFYRNDYIKVFAGICLFEGLVYRLGPALVTLSLSTISALIVRSDAIALAQYNAKQGEQGFITRSLRRKDGKMFDHSKISCSVGLIACVWSFFASPFTFRCSAAMILGHSLAHIREGRTPPVPAKASSRAVGSRGQIRLHVTPQDVFRPVPLAGPLSPPGGGVEGQPAHDDAQEVDRQRHEGAHNVPATES